MSYVKHGMGKKFLSAVHRLDELEEDTDLRESRIRAAEDLLIKPAVEAADWDDMYMFNREAMLDHRESVLHNKASEMYASLFSTYRTFGGRSTESTDRDQQ